MLNFVNINQNQAEKLEKSRRKQEKQEISMLELPATLEKKKVDWVFLEYIVKWQAYEMSYQRKRKLLKYYTIKEI